MTEQSSLILVVDDEEEIRKILSRILEKEGFRVITAPDGEQAQRRICFDAPDIVLLDVRMPGLSGMEVL
jgi:CheY-like chemotaxis protein